MHENDLATIIVDCAYKVHLKLGPGILETVYQAALAHELKKRGLTIALERGIPVEYDEVRLDVGFRADIIVENKVILSSARPSTRSHRFTAEFF